MESEIRIPRRNRRAYEREKTRVRVFVGQKIAYWNALYGFSVRRIFIKNHKRLWGSCSVKGNLNFSYRLIFLPPRLQDYIIVHELCHLAELNHSPKFWARVRVAQPEYLVLRKELRRVS